MTPLELFCQIDDFATFYEAATGYVISVVARSWG